MRRASWRSPAPARRESAGRASARSTFNTYTGAPTEAAIDAEYGYHLHGWRRAYLLCDRLVEYTKVMCEAFRTRWKALGGTFVGEDTFRQSDVSIAAQVQAARERPEARCRRARVRPRWLARDQGLRARYDGPLILRGVLLRDVLAEADAAPLERLGRRDRLQLRRRPA